MKKYELKTEEDIKPNIFKLRGINVILDRNLAKLYEIKPFRLREQVKRNKSRFPSDFMFQVTKEELDFLVSQNAIPSKKYTGGFLPLVFTEQGVAMISGILKSNIAVIVNIEIMRAFVKMRKFIFKNEHLFYRMDLLEKKLKHDIKFDKIFNAIEDKTISLEQGIFYNGQIYDAYKFIINIIKKAKKSIVLIDNYVDTNTLAILSEKNKKVSIEIKTLTISKQLEFAKNKFNEQYGKLKITKFDKSHDRFIIIDDIELYFIGASLKDLGKKIFAFSKIDRDLLKI